MNDFMTYLLLLDKRFGIDQTPSKSGYLAHDFSLQFRHFWNFVKGKKMFIEAFRMKLCISDLGETGIDVLSTRPLSTKPPPLRTAVFKARGVYTCAGEAVQYLARPG